MSAKRSSLWALVGIALAAGSLAGCQKSQPEPGRYYAKADGFSIRFPADWERKENVMGTTVVAMSPEAAGDEFRENVNVVVEPLASPMDLEAYLALGLANMTRLLAEGAEPEVADAELGASPAKRIIYETTLGQVRVKGLMVLAVKGQRGYAMTCSAMPETFETFRPTFDEIAGTFRFE